MRTGKLQWFLWFLMIRMSVAQQLSLFTLGFEELYGGPDHMAQHLNMIGFPTLVLLYVGNL